MKNLGLAALFTDPRSVLHPELQSDGSISEIQESLLNGLHAFLIEQSQDIHEAVSEKWRPSVRKLVKIIRLKP